MDFQDVLEVSEQAETASGLVVYIISGIGILLAILIVLWLLFKLANLIIRKKTGKKKPKKSDEEEIFGD